METLDNNNTQHAQKPRPRSFFSDDRGVSAMEYAVLGALVAIILVTSLTSIGTKILAYFQAMAALLK